MLLALYRTTTSGAGPLIRLVLKQRQARGKEDPVRIGERLGHASLPRPPGRLVWVHGASVGESLAILPLIEALLERRPGLQVLVTSGTVTSARLLETRLPKRARHQFLPVDHPRACARFFAHWRPDLGLVVESELWPNLITTGAAADVPLALVNGRMSERSFRRWLRLRAVVGTLLGQFEQVLAQSDLDRARFERLGARDVRNLGNLKRAAAPLPADPARLEALRAALAGRTVWLAASTHPGEEEVVFDLHRQLSLRFETLMTLVVPRHPERGLAIVEAARQRGHGVGLRSAGDLPTAATGIYVADTIGELGLFYRLAPLAFIGGSLVPHGGQNPLEGARLGCPPLYGPNVWNFAEVAATLEACAAAERVDDGAALGRALERWLGAPEALQAFAERARSAAESEGEVLDRTLDALAPLLERALGAADAAA